MGLGTSCSVAEDAKGSVSSVEVGVIKGLLPVIDAVEEEAKDDRRYMDLRS